MSDVVAHEGMLSHQTADLDIGELAGGRGELTWGQRFVWDILSSLAPSNHFINLRFRLHLPPDATRARVLDALTTLVRRHEGLRSRFLVDAAGEPQQETDTTGTLQVEIWDADPAHLRSLADQEEERLWRRPFENAVEWPLRVSVITSIGRPRQVVFVFSHLATDAWGWSVLRGEFLDLLRDELPGEAVVPIGWQPRARAEYEASPGGRRTSERSLAYWRQVLEVTAPTAFPNRPRPGEQPLFPGVRLQSLALAAAAQAVAARHRVGPAAAVLGVLSMLIGHRTGTDLVPLCLAAGNRYTPEEVASVGTFYQTTLALLPVDAASLAATIRNAHRASTLAYLRGQVDPREVARLLKKTNADRGIDIELQSTVNVLPEPTPAGAPSLAPPERLRALAASTRVTELEGRDRERLKLYLHVQSLRSRAVIELFSDSRYLTAADARRLLAGLEIALIELLDAGDLSLDRVAGLVGITPLPEA